jgi:hypothetical protein
MRAEEGIDFAWYKPTVAQIRALGASWAAGYLSTDTSKNWTPALVAEYLAAGVGVVTVWETTTTRATAGWAAGVADARAADSERAALGLGADHPIYFAVDEDVPWSVVQAYFDGAASVIGLGRVGAYGGYRVVEGAYGHGIRYLWQTVAWSGGLWSVHADIRQPGGTLLAGQADIDYAEVPDFGQSPRPKPPAPTPVPRPTLLEDDVYSYLPPLPPNADTDLPIEPAGTSTAPQGGARNGPLWLGFAPQGADGTVTITEHTAKGWGKPTPYPVKVDGPKVVFELPLDGSVDKVRIRPSVPTLGYLVGRQVA